MTAPVEDFVGRQRDQGYAWIAAVHILDIVVHFSPMRGRTARS
ncbi:hypothetical protein JOF56_004333 [Kibdelosporangium banguiense]|uniref:Uncharacterized protein n=1 Tax=Kibdelosporangium banguiense TaxID=1365924 RepID=A0ABS4TJ59_9PSEU|nr:hypothetical protein [Kibdelosporangium banguiense]MBP2323948.1 hypothetical protein [Kibdelosporangium banguiense]